MKKNLLLSTEKNIFKSKWTMRILSLAIIAAVMFSTISMGALPVFADEADDTLNSVMWQILDIVFKIFKYVGVLLLVWAIAQLVMAFKNEDADSKQRSMILAVIAVVLIALESLITGIVNQYIGTKPAIIMFNIT